MAEESLNLLVGYTDWYLAGIFRGGSAEGGDGADGVCALGFCDAFSLISIGRWPGRPLRRGGEAERGQPRRQPALLLGSWLAGIGIFFFLIGDSGFVSAMQLRPEAGGLARVIPIMTPAIPAIMLRQIGFGLLRGSGDAVTD